AHAQWREDPFLNEYFPWFSADLFDHFTGGYIEYVLVDEARAHGVAGFYIPHLPQDLFGRNVHDAPHKICVAHAAVMQKQIADPELARDSRIIKLVFGQVRSEERRVGKECALL